MKLSENLKNVLRLLLLIALALLLFKLSFGTGNDEKMVADLPTINDVKELKEHKTEEKKSFWRMQAQPTKTLAGSGIPRERYDSILNALKIKEKEVTALTITKGVFADSLKLTRLQLDEAKNKVWEWEKIYPSGSRTLAKMSEKDSVLHPQSDVAVAVIEREEGDKYYLDFYPLDDNFKFNGASVFRKEQKEIRDIMELYVNGTFTKGYYLSEFDRVAAEAGVKFNPDGKFIFFITTGADYYLQTGKVSPFYKAAVQYNLLRWKKRR